MNKAIIEKARLFAIQAHGDQRYGEHPYSKHLDDVHQILLPYFGEDEEHGEVVLVSGWLHDTMEDTDTTFRQIFDEFGRHVARTVFAVTDEPGKNRKERHERTYPKIRAGGREPLAVKLGDRLGNANHSARYNHDMLRMYQREYPAFREYLHIPGELKGLWAALDVVMATRLEPAKERPVDPPA